jgi:hypothetical protein
MPTVVTPDAKTYLFHSSENYRLLPDEFGLRSHKIAQP